jgi:ribonuclease P protein component
MPRQSLPKRFARRADFLRLAAQGRKIVKTGFVMQVLQNPAAPAPLVGFTATKKLGNAVIRNRTKRRLREAARLVLAAHPGAPVELVLVGRRETATMDFARLRHNLAQAVREALA